MGINFCNFVLKITLYPLTILLILLRVIVTNFSTIFLQSIDITNFYWFVFVLITYIIFLLINSMHHIINL